MGRLIDSITPAGLQGIQQLVSGERTARQNALQRRNQRAITDAKLRANRDIADLQSETQLELGGMKQQGFQEQRDFQKEQAEEERDFRREMFRKQEELKIRLEKIAAQSAAGGMSGIFSGGGTGNILHDMAPTIFPSVQTPSAPAPPNVTM